LKGEDFLYDKVSNHQSDLLTFGGQCTWQILVIGYRRRRMHTWWIS
jgi:hypothetical protein